MRPAPQRDPFEPTKKTVVLPTRRASVQQKMELLISNPQFQNDVDRIRMKTQGKDEVPALLKKYKLSREWGYLIDIYILTGKIEFRGDPLGVRITFNSNKPFADIRVYPQTTLKELKRAHAYILKELKAGKKTRNATAINFKRDLFIYNEHSKGKSYREIMTMVAKEYRGMDIPDLGNLKRIVSKMKQRGAAL